MCKPPPPPAPFKCLGAPENLLNSALPTGLVWHIYLQYLWSLSLFFTGHRMFGRSDCHPIGLIHLGCRRCTCCALWRTLSQAQHLELSPGVPPRWNSDGCETQRSKTCRSFSWFPCELELVVSGIRRSVSRKSKDPSVSAGNTGYFHMAPPSWFTCLQLPTRHFSQQTLVLLAPGQWGCFVHNPYSKRRLPPAWWRISDLLVPSWQ